MMITAKALASIPVRENTSNGGRRSESDPELAEKLRELREAYGLRARDVSGAIGVTVQQLYNYEAARVTPSVPSLVRIALFYEVDFNYLLGHRLAG